MSEKHLDDLLDQAMATYAQDPRPGLEQRILTHVQAESQRRPFTLPWWTLALPLLACALFIIIKPLQKLEELPPPPTTQIHPPELTTLEPSNPPARKRAQLPKQEVFPSPQTLTEGERAFLSLVNQHPEEATRLVTNLQQTSLPEIEPLEIKPITTEPKL